MMQPINPLKPVILFADKNKIIEQQVKKNNEIVYGARALNANVGNFNSRPTDDYDIYSNTPKQSATQLSTQLNKHVNAKLTYPKQSEYHKTTFKVMNIGPDNKPKTKDDYGMVDYTKLERNIKTIQKNGIRYAHYLETKKDKLKSLSDKEYSFRHKKDGYDLKTIQIHEKKQKSFLKIKNMFKKRLL